MVLNGFQSVLDSCMWSSLAFRAQKKSNFNNSFPQGKGHFAPNICRWKMQMRMETQINHSPSHLALTLRSSIQNPKENQNFQL